jgi:hypothetical protein
MQMILCSNRTTIDTFMMAMVMLVYPLLLRAMFKWQAHDRIRMGQAWFLAVQQLEYVIMSVLTAHDTRYPKNGVPSVGIISGVLEFLHAGVFTITFSFQHLYEFEDLVEHGPEGVRLLSLDRPDHIHQHKRAHLCQGSECGVISSQWQYSQYKKHVRPCYARLSSCQSRD